jgi:PTH1 family peptidyl-tRNA hydrolase
MDKENIPLENIFIITDDLNFFWNSSIKPKEVMAGQRFKNINLVLNTQTIRDFALESVMIQKRKTSRLCFGEWDDAENWHYQND